MSSADCVTVTTLVAVDPAAAFAVFTEDIDLWWRRGPRFRFDPGREGVLRFEPGPGGRLLEQFGPDAGDSFEVGRVTAWEPPRRLAFEFRARSFGPSERTEVEICFEPEGASTRVTLEHRGWDSLRADHPARHGLTGGAFTSMMGLFWADLLVAARAYALHRRGE